ncbi:hypothetical protein IAQ61_008370 [Plenodomus lingam]|uniref:Predicted protein n=1 Tax=Leptosphaeria maculans (strain JN3 / isolate v23.1.3 / race Av1-4-5-6-7-8) TaxID=985895 RepID=E4ZUZ0_LEPMJ|nr:predicted protein [Plenodomus lingam JN3]KAH9866365.1 hypothetical protein IAQ61_008370 [Plenodomus lingam]CBX94927.1 predicted protein [Plenodomus lingam JN3]
MYKESQKCWHDGTDEKIGPNVVHQDERNTSRKAISVQRAWQVAVLDTDRFHVPANAKPTI